MRSLALALCVSVLVAHASCKATAPDAGAKEPAPSAVPRSSARAPTAAPVDSTPLASATLTINVDGKPMKWEHAFVKRLPDGKLQLFVGPGGSCAELLINLFNGSARHLLVDLPSKLAADGTESYAVAGLNYGPPTDADPGGIAKVSGNLRAGSRVDIELAFRAKGGRDEQLEVKGRVVAESCGDQDTSKGVLPNATHASSASMTIAKKKIPIRAALVKGDTVELSDFPRDCTTAWFLGARLRRENGKWLLDGTRFEKETEGAPTALTVKSGKSGKSADGPTVELTLSGSDKIGDYPITITGTVEAIDCK
jgi:hypothetical protein